jgi:general stress protein YciG
MVFAIKTGGSPAEPDHVISSPCHDKKTTPYGTRFSSFTASVSPTASISSSLRLRARWHPRCTGWAEGGAGAPKRRARREKWEEDHVAKEDRGFASMDRAKQREIASKGGKAAHQKGTAHEWTSEEARDAGRKGGIASHRRRREQTEPDTSAEETRTPEAVMNSSSSMDSSPMSEDE